MSKLLKIIVANFCVALLYLIAYYISYRLGASTDDLIKFLPTASVSAVGTIVTLSLTMLALVKGREKMTIGEPELMEWSIMIPLSIDCRESGGITFEGIESESLDYSKLVEVSAQAIEKQLPVIIKAGEIAEYEIHFEALEGAKGEIVNLRKLLVSCSYRREGKLKRHTISMSCNNVFRKD